MKTLSVQLVRKANSFTSEARKSGKWIISEHTTRPESRISTRAIFRKHYAPRQELFPTTPFLASDGHLNFADFQDPEQLFSYNEDSVFANVIQRRDFGTSLVSVPVLATPKSVPLSVGFRSWACPYAT
jgi:hypothetical protein